MSKPIIVTHAWTKGTAVLKVCRPNDLFLHPFLSPLAVNWQRPLCSSRSQSWYFQCIFIFFRTEDPQSPTVPFLSLSSDGTINLWKPIRIMSTCNLDIYKFPFDTQKCNLTFGTYVHTGMWAGTRCGGGSI